MRDEIRAGLRLSPVLLVALLLAAFVWQSDTAALSGLFQSSVLPTPTVRPTLPVSHSTPTTIPPRTPAPPATPFPATQTPVLVPTAGLTATLTPTLQLVPTSPLTVTPVITVTPAAGSAEPTPAEASATPDDRQRYAEDDSNVKFEWSMLFDSLSLFLSYAWLCCGILVFLAIPVFFVVLWIASKRRQQQQ